MKRNIISTAVFVMTLTASAQTLSLSNGTVVYHYPATAAELPFGADNTLTIGEKVFSLEEYSLMKVASTVDVEPNTVLVTYIGEKAAVEIHGSVADYVAVTVSGAHVNITQAATVSESTCGEITYVLQGESSDGSFVLNGSYKASIDLNGVSLKNLSGAAIDIENGKRINLSAKNGSENYLEDGAGSQKAALYCKGHLELKGKGALTVKGNKGHAISTKEYVTIKNLSLTVAGAIKDGINCNQYFAMESGTVTISGTSDDGIQVSYKDDTDREAEDTGAFSLTGGTLNIDIAAGEASKGIKADGDVNIDGGVLTVNSSCNGIWDEAKVKTKASACIGADGNVTVGGGTLTLTASGSGGKGISCDGVFTSNGGEFAITTTGGMLVYRNGQLNHNYTGTSDNIDSNYKSSAKGIKADSGLVINDGKFTIYTSSNNAEGIESKSTLEIHGGNLFIKAYDDGINSSGDLTVTGGTLTVIAVAGDGIDSNANLYITGGTICTLGSGGAEQGLDAADESRCAVYITGGNVLSFGGRAAPVSKTSDSQALVSVSCSISASTTVAVKTGSEELVSFEIPSEYTSSSTGPRFGPGSGPGGDRGPGGGSGSGRLQISCGGLVGGSTYTVTNGNSSQTATATYTSTAY